MENKKIIRVRAVQDKEFKNSYWSFDIAAELTKASQEFKKQFGVGFELTEIGDWNSVGYPFLKDFPFNVIQRIPKGLSIEEVIDYLVFVCRKRMGFFVEVSQEEREDICSTIRNQCPAYQIGFWEGRLGYWLLDYLFHDLKEKEPMDSEIGATIALSGKLSMWLHSSGRVRNQARIFTKEAYVLIGNTAIDNSQIAKVILHEIGHLFGAQHVRRTRSVMKQGSLIYKFDRRNRKIIWNTIKQLKELN